jgi:hypothetical protein
MFVSELSSTYVSATRAGGEGGGAALGLFRAMVVRWNRHRSLMAWNRNLIRLAGCARLSSRAWCRHSARLTLRAGGPLK